MIYKIKCLFAFLLCMLLILNACGQQTILTESGESRTDIATDGGIETPSILDDADNVPEAEDSSIGRPGAGEASKIASSGTESSKTVSSETTPPKMDAMQELFGADCISEQTFEVQISEYAQKVWFVPFAPSQENPQFRVQLIQNGQVLEELRAYVPDNLAEEEFVSLDAVSFWDVNYDGNTDIVLLETYGDTRFAAVYYGEYIYYIGIGFYLQQDLSGNLSDQVNPLTISEIRNFLAGGKKNGEFTSYQEAYEAVSRLYELEGAEGTSKREYNLIYFDEDDTPELVAGVSGYFMSLYTYNEGTVYCLMNDWGYGAFGNAGYEYVPGKNSLRNYNADFAGLILYITYMGISPQHSLDQVVQIEVVNFNDMNGNGYPDGEEEKTIGEYSTIYIDGVEATEEQNTDYDAGEYEYIETTISWEELLEMLEH